MYENVLTVNVDMTNGDNILVDYTTLCQESDLAPQLQRTFDHETSVVLYNC